MDKDRLDLLKETEGYIPPVCPLTGEERKNFYLRLSAVMNVSEEQFLSGKLYSSEHDDKPEELKTSLAEFLRSI